MIHRIKTVTWEVRSHRNCTTLSDQGVMTSTTIIDLFPIMWKKPALKRVIWHLQDVLRCVKQIEKERQDRKDQEEKEDKGT